MKGTFFQKPLELSLRIDGESWRQGDTIAGQLVVKNPGSAAVPHAPIAVHLAYGELKKVRQKSPDAFTVVESAQVIPHDGKLDAQKEISGAWSFKTDRNCWITETGGSLFMLYGQGDPAAGAVLGQLQLAMSPFWIIDEILQLFVTGFRFVVKIKKSDVKNWVNVKLDPPDSKAFVTLDQLVVSFRFEEDEILEMRYAFHLKKIEATAAAFDMKKSKHEVKQSFRRDQYLTTSGRFNFEPIEAAIRQALEPVTGKLL